MTELHTIYRRSNEEKEEFLRRIIPLLLGRCANRQMGHAQLVILGSIAGQFTTPGSKAAGYGWL